MGILDLELMFDLLDAGMTGFLTRDQLQEMHEELYFSPIDSRHIEATIVSVCGHNADGKCAREYFMAVLQELDRRKSLEEKILWDFKTLDAEGHGRITIKSTLFLFKAVHGELFSMQTWKAFLAGRINPQSDVCFDEVKMFLCNLPVGGPSERSEFLEEEKELSRCYCDSEYRNLKDLERLQVRASPSSMFWNQEMKLKRPPPIKQQQQQQQQPPRY